MLNDNELGESTHFLWLGKLRPREQEKCALLPAGVYGLLGLLITRTLRNYSEVQSSLIILIRDSRRPPRDLWKQFLSIWLELLKVLLSH